MCDSIPVPHIHTGEFTTTEFKEYFCPSRQEWTLCSNPCPDGSEHSETRLITTNSEIVKLIKE